MSIPSAVVPFMRKAWIPVASDGDGDIRASKFAGAAWLSQSEQWPRCQNCSQPMELFLQLNLDELPEQIGNEYGEGLMQLFYCAKTETICESLISAWEPFSKATLVRLVQPEGEPHAETRPGREDSFPPKLIVGWKEADDYPIWEEGKYLGIEMDEAQWEELGNDDFPRPGDKLAGWPLWAQNVDYPNCPACGDQMRLVFQLDSYDNLPFMFGDAGTGHITQCRAHKSQVAFSWACA